MVGQVYGFYNFRREGCMIISPGLFASNNSNEDNPREVAFLSGNPDIAPSTGAIRYVTNSTMCQYVYNRCNAVSQTSAIDGAFVDIFPSTNQLEITLDGFVLNNGGGGTVLIHNWLSHFNARTGLGANIYQIVAGKILINFSTNGDNLEGRIELRGINFSRTGNPTYIANFTGTKTTDSQCYE